MNYNSLGKLLLEELNAVDSVRLEMRAIVRWTDLLRIILASY